MLTIDNKSKWFDMKVDSEKIISIESWGAADMMCNTFHFAKGLALAIAAFKLNQLWRATTTWEKAILR